MTVDECAARMGAQELAEWAHVFRIEDEAMRAATGKPLGRRK